MMKMGGKVVFKEDFGGGMRDLYCIYIFSGLVRMGRLEGEGDSGGRKKIDKEVKKEIRI